MRQLSLPTGIGLQSIAAASVTWLGAVAGWSWGLPAAVIGGVAGLAAVATRRWLAGALLVAAVASGWAAAARVESTLTAALSEGPVVLAGSVTDEPIGSVSGGTGQFVLRPRQQLAEGQWRRVDLPPLAVAGRTRSYAPTAGDQVIVRGLLRSAPGRTKGDPVAGRVSGASVEFVSASGNPLFVVGNALRRRVGDQVDDRRHPAAASLLRGFLIGDTSGLDPTDGDALRRAGLSHFVAVSGSNVALFLAGWWVVTAPIARRPRIRAGLGLIGLGVFVVVTRWEPSVVRAATIAGIVLSGRLLGFPIDAWTALGAAVTALLLISGDLAISVGFQLSVFATAGVLAGARLFAGRRPKWAWTALAATLSAQVAVVPFLLLHFGTIPVLSPVANIAAAPIVAIATVSGGAGVATGWEAPIVVALLAARAVLGIARVAAGWPQLGIVGVTVAAATAGLLRWRRSRMVVAAAAMAGWFAAVVPAEPPDVATATFLDVGQGDAVLLRDPLGTVVLIDGGRAPDVLRDSLRRHGVRRIDLLVVTHGDADHAGGLEGIVAEATVGQIWVPDQPDLGDVVPVLIAEAVGRGIPVRHLRTGPVARLGGFSIEVVGPIRRYSSSNDGSVVLWVEVGGHSILLPGDIEAIAQRELGPLTPDVLLVPHHGSATTDLQWLASTVGYGAVVSVGENSYGHPSAQVLRVLRDSGARIWITAEVGDVSIAFG